MCISYYSMGPLVTFDLYEYSVIGDMIVSAGLCSCNKNVGCFSAIPDVGTLTISGSSYFGNALGIASIANVSNAILYFMGLPGASLIVGDLATVVFVPGIYYSTGAVTNSGTITFDARNSIDASFVIRIDAAFASAASSSMKLVNGATSDMIFWVITGAVSTGALSHVEGSLLSRGAISFGAGAGINGRILSVGTVTLSSTVIVTTMVTVPVVVPVVVTTTSTSTTTSSSPLTLYSLDTCSLVGNIINNVGASTCNRDVACVVPAVSIPTLTIGGAQNLGNAIGVASATNLTAAITHYSQLVPTQAFGGDIIGTTFLPGVYHCGTALANTGVVTLDAKNQTSASFVFQIDGAFALAASTTMLLTNGATSDMIYWVVTGAVITGAQTHIEGNLMIVGAVTFGANTTVTGRVLSIGAVNIANSTIYTAIPVVVPTQSNVTVPTTSNVTYSSQSIVSQSNGITLLDGSSNEILNIYGNGSNNTCISAPIGETLQLLGDSTVQGNLDVSQSLHVGGELTLSCGTNSNIWFQFCTSTLNQLTLKKFKRDELGVVTFKKVAEFGDIPR